MAYYPIIMDITGRKCLIVGGGEVALRKAQSLVEAGAEVTIIAPKVNSSLRELGNVRIEERCWREGDTSGYTLVFAATGDRAVNQAVSDEAERNAIPVNVVDDPELCSFIVPACVRRGDLLIAITTSGASPMLSKRIRIELEERYGPEYAEFVRLLGELRDVVKRKYTEQQDRETAFDRLVNCGILELLSAGKREEAGKKAFDCI